MPERPWWVYQLETWDRDGALNRIEKARDEHFRLKVRRSDGSISKCVIVSMGHCGRSLQVRIETPDGPRYKDVHTEDFLELNPEIGPALKDPREPNA